MTKMLLVHLSCVVAAAALSAFSVAGFSSVQPYTIKTSTAAGFSTKRQLASRIYLAADNNNNKDDATTTTTAPATTRNEILNDANDALTSVGWAPPREDGEMTSDDPFVQRINAGIQRDVGVDLDELLNPAKVVNLERDLYNLRLELASLTGVELDDATKSTAALTTEQCDGTGGGTEADAVRARIEKKEKDLIIERRSVFRGWLKNVFLVQAILSFGLSWVMATNPESLFGQFGWFNSYNMDISIMVLGYWWWWLFIIPSLRSRRPRGAEKKALDIAFLASPIISLTAPVATKDTGLIWVANLVVVLSCYGFAYTVGDDDNGSNDDSKQPEWLKFVYKSLDFGSGRERGARQ